MDACMTDLSVQSFVLACMIYLGSNCDVRAASFAAAVLRVVLVGFDAVSARSFFWGGAKFEDAHVHVSFFVRDLRVIFGIILIAYKCCVRSPTRADNSSTFDAV